MERSRARRRKHDGSGGLTGCNSLPSPASGERPTAYADRVGEWYVATKSDEYRKARGLYLTPVPVADFMGRRIKVSGRRMRVLDPAAGSGTLCCAAVEAIVTRPSAPERIELVAHEVDAGLSVLLRTVLDHLAEWCRRNHRVRLEARVEASDFVLAHREALRSTGDLLSRESADRNFDVVIANPPYFKIGRSDPRALAVPAVVHGQPNIYALFMAVSAVLLRPEGDFIFITPRSFASGPYFRQFRTTFLEMIRPAEVHVFRSRRDAFHRDAVLQETVIVTGVRRDRWYRDDSRAVLAISSSRGAADIDESERRAIPMEVALDLETSDKVLKLPLSVEDDQALALVHSWPNRLHRLGLNISTGPVVPFRATGLIDREGRIPRKHVPLLWMNHVRAMQVTWPLNRHKLEYIRRSGSEALLVPNRNYVLLRRFSAKEEQRRLSAAPYLASDFTVPGVGLENHLNYVHRPGGSLSEDEAWGLAALYNSRLLDTCFRCVNGNTQVSATELRAMPLPDHAIIVTLGRRVKHLSKPMEGLDDLVTELTVTPVQRRLAGG